MNALKKWIQLFRAFFPSWRFFTDVESDLNLEIRSGPSEDGLKDWTIGIPRIRRSFSNLLINSGGNLLHAERSVLRNLVLDLDPDLDVSDLVYYKIAQNLVRLKLSERKFEFGYYQFRIREQEANGDPTDTLLLSPVYPW